MVESAAQSPTITPSDVIYMPHRRRLFHEWGQDAEQRTLTLHYGDKEVLFDEPAQIPFGAALLEHARFVAGDAAQWTSAGDWGTARELLEALVDAGILAIEPPGAARCPVAHVEPQPETIAVEPETPARARTWTAAETPALAHELFGVQLEIGQLETLLRCWQIPHPVQDVHGRQLGDENVFPPALRIETRIERRTCLYPGSRHRQSAGINVTSLRMVQEAWPEAIAILHLLKAELLSRRARGAAALSLAELYALATTVLALPAWLVQRHERPFDSGELPSSIGALFRIIDGTRLASRFAVCTDDPELRASTFPTPEQLYVYCEKNLLFFNGSRGVCAGPPATVREFLAEVMRTDGPADLAIASALRDALGELGPAIDYGLAAFELELELDRFWILQTEIARELHRELSCCDVEASPAALRLRTRLGDALGRARIVPFLDVPLDVARARVLASIAEVVATCRALRTTRAVAPRPTRCARLELADTAALDDAVAEAIGRALERLDALEHDATVRIDRLQAEVNAILGRTPPTSSFGPAELARAWPGSSVRAAIVELRDALAPPIAANELPTPRAGDGRHLPVVRGLFARARFGLATAVRRTWGQSFDSDLDAARALPALVRASGGWPPLGAAPSVLDVLARLFLAGEPLPSGTVRGTLRDREWTALHETGLVVERGAMLASPFAVAAVDGLYIVTDNAATIAAGREGGREAGANALVMPGYVETYLFAARMHRHPVERSLDLCTGGGVHALLGARHAEHSVGTDVSARAIAFAEWNRRTNGIDRAQFHVGDVYAAVAGTRFDRITANPPYQPDAHHSAGENWWGGGPRGDAILDRIVAGLPDHLAEGGELQVIGRFLSWPDGDVLERMRRLLGDQRDAFVVELDADDEPVAEIVAMYPGERLAELVRAQYGVLTITRGG